MSTPEPKRLPPNPRRNKVAPEQRKRVAAACNHCNVRRVKCSGDRPCLQCAKLNRECHYPTQIDKVTIPKSELDQLRHRCAELEKQLQDSGLPQPLTAGNASFASREQASFTLPLARGTRAESSSQHEDEESPLTLGRLLRDMDGRTRYQEETSGFTFLDALKSFMATAVPLAFQNENPASFASSPFLGTIGQYQSLDSRPLVLPAVDPLWLPPKAEMERLLSTLDCFVADGGGAYPSGGLCFWGPLAKATPDPSLAVPSAGYPTSASHRSLAFYHTAFACASLIAQTAGNAPGQDASVADAYFARARLLLGNPLDTTLWSPSDLATLGLMAMYLTENNRRDAAYVAIGCAMQIAIIHGINKGWSVDESGKRIFWTIFVIDRWMSLLSGRPATMNDEAIALSLPQECPGLPSPVGLLASVLLCKISCFLTTNGHRLTPRSFPPNSSVSYFDEALNMLDEWHANLPPVLQLSDDEISRDRGAIQLHLGYNQLCVLTIRPVFLLAVKKAVADQFTSRKWAIEDHPQIHRIRQCSDAARRNLRLARWLREVSPAHKLLLPELHYIFSAAIIIMLHQIVFVNLRTNDVSDIEFAIDAFEREASAGAAYAIVYTSVLKDLLVLVHRLRSLTFDGMQVAGSLQGPLPGEEARLSLSSGSPGTSGTAPRPDLNPAMGDDIFHVLETWLRDDAAQPYNSYLI